MATVAPNRDRFADGVLNLEWDEEKRKKEYETVMKYFQAFLGFANDSGLPFLDLYTPSLKDQTGDLTFISNVDYIHLSFEGRVFIAKELSTKLAKLL